MRCVYCWFRYQFFAILIWAAHSRTEWENVEGPWSHLFALHFVSSLYLRIPRNEETEKWLPILWILCETYPESVFQKRYHSGWKEINWWDRSFNFWHIRQYSLGKRPAERACEFDGSNADATRKVVGRPSTYRKKQHLRSHLRSYAATYGTPDI